MGIIQYEVCEETRSDKKQIMIQRYQGGAAARKMGRGKSRGTCIRRAIGVSQSAGRQVWGPQGRGPGPLGRGPGPELRRSPHLRGAEGRGDERGGEHQLEVTGSKPWATGPGP